MARCAAGTLFGAWTKSFCVEPSTEAVPVAAVKSASVQYRRPGKRPRSPVTPEPVIDEPVIDEPIIDEHVVDAPTATRSWSTPRPGWVPVDDSGDPDAWFRANGLNPFALLGMTMEEAAVASPVVADPPKVRSRQSLLPVVGKSASRASTTCTRCSMVYSPHDAEDVRAHEAFCARQGAPAALPAALARLPSVPIDTKEDLRVVSARVSDASSGPLLQAVADALKALELGMGSRVVGHTPRVDLPSLQRVGLRPDEACLTVLVCASASRGRKRAVIAGVATTEPIEGATRKPADDVVFTTGTTLPARLGVRQVWVHPHFRRRGVGTLLLQAAQRTGLRGGAVSRDDMALSAPTTAGARLGASFFQRPDFLVYGVD
jgi:GNAT superfamily N-acetyltransferase